VIDAGEQGLHEAHRTRGGGPMDMQEMAKRDELLDLLRAAACDYGYHVWGCCDYRTDNPDNPEDMLALVKGVLSEPQAAKCNGFPHEAKALWRGMTDAERRAWAERVTGGRPMETRYMYILAVNGPVTLVRVPDGEDTVTGLQDAMYGLGDMGESGEVRWSLRPVSTAEGVFPSAFTEEELERLAEFVRGQQEAQGPGGSVWMLTRLDGEPVRMPGEQPSSATPEADVTDAGAPR
jgi:hypothetical protein